MRSQRRQSIAPDLTPLIDVVFILLIFFMVTTVFKKEQLALELNLPTSQAVKLEVEPKDISIELSVDTLAINGQKIVFDELEARLQVIKEKTKTIILRIDKDVPYSQIVLVLDDLQKQDLNNISLVTDK